MVSKIFRYKHTDIRLPIYVDIQKDTWRVTAAGRAPLLHKNDPWSGSNIPRRITSLTPSGRVRSICHFFTFAGTLWKSFFLVAKLLYNYKCPRVLQVLGVTRFSRPLIEMELRYLWMFLSLFLYTLLSWQWFYFRDNLTFRFKNKIFEIKLDILNVFLQ